MSYFHQSLLLGTQLAYSAPAVDHEVRWMMLKLAEMTFRAGDEALPKVVIHLPPTPVNEQAPILPLVLNKSKMLGKAQAHITSEATLSPTIAKIRLPSAVRPTSPALALSSAKSQQIVPAKATPAIQKKKAKAVPKGQSGGMSNNDLTACRKALKRLLAHKKSFLFSLPVDPVRDRAPK